MDKINIEPDDMLCSDYHIGHNKDFIWRDRQFGSPEEHHEYMLEVLRKTLETNRVISLGDVMFKARKEIRKQLLEILEHPNFLSVPGNHDQEFLRAHMSENRILSDVVFGHLDKKKNKVVVLSHFPLLEWPSKWRGAYHFHGHCHGNLPCDSMVEKRADISVDLMSTLFDIEIMPVSALVDFVDRRDELMKEVSDG